MGLEEGRIDLAAPDGAKLAVYTVGAGPPLLLVHGIGGDHTRWRPLYPFLAERFTIYAMDRRGRGGSTNGPNYDLKLEYDDVATVLSNLGTSVNLLGHGFGALCCLGAVRRLPQSNVRKLVLYEPSLPLSGESLPPGLLDRMRLLLNGGDRERVLSMYLVEDLRLLPPEIEMLKTATSWMGRLGSARAIPRELAAEQEYRFDDDGYQDFTVPTLLFEGGASPPRLRQAVARVHRAMASSRVVTLPNQKHLAMDTSPESFMQELVNFLTT